MKLFNKSIVVSLLLAGVITNAHAASVTYDYVGNDLDSFSILNTSTNQYETSQIRPSSIGSRVTGSATFADGIDSPVTNFMLSDGITTLDSTITNSGSTSISPLFVMTFNNGNVFTWDIGFNFSEFYADVNGGNIVENNKIIVTGFNNAAESAADRVFIINYSRPNFTVLFDERGELINSPGTWTLRQDQVSAVPVPATLPLMASAMGLFGLAKRRKQSV